MFVIDFIRGATTTETSATEFQPLFSAADLAIQWSGSSRFPKHTSGTHQYIQSSASRHSIRSFMPCPNNIAAPLIPWLREYRGSAMEAAAAAIRPVGTQARRFAKNQEVAV
jgi:hypothetical protein